MGFKFQRQFYQTGQFTADFNLAAGAGGSNTSYTIQFLVIGQLIALQFPQIEVTTGGAAHADISAGASIPAAFAPKTNLTIPSIMIVSGSTVNTIGTIIIGSDGSLTLRRTPDGGTNWPTANASNGIARNTVTYTTL